MFGSPCFAGVKRKPRFSQKKYYSNYSRRKTIPSFSSKPLVQIKSKCCYYGSFRMTMRPGDADTSIAKEVLVRKVYKQVARGGKGLCWSAHRLFQDVRVESRSRFRDAYEPFPPSPSLLGTNLSGQDICIVGKAVNPEAGNVRLYLHKKTSARHTLLETKGRESILREAASIYSILTQHQDVSAVKLDVEGAEIAIL